MLHFAEKIYFGVQEVSFVGAGKGCKFQAVEKETPSNMWGLWLSFPRDINWTKTLVGFLKGLNTYVLLRLWKMLVSRFLEGKTEEISEAYGTGYY